jgi:dTDP-4-amino-4,6-dideoxygalactose transaminase
MNDISASIGIASLEELKETLNRRREIFHRYKTNLETIKLKIMENNLEDRDFTPWLLTLNCGEKRIELMNHLRRFGIESAQVHYRNDRYSIFENQKQTFKNMDALEDAYLVVPLYPQMTNNEVDFVSSKILDVLSKN